MVVVFTVALVSDSGEQQQVVRGETHNITPYGAIVLHALSPLTNNPNSVFQDPSDLPLDESLSKRHNVTEKNPTDEIPQYYTSDSPLGNSSSERHTVAEKVPEQRIPNGHTSDVQFEEASLSEPQTLNNVIVHKTPDTLMSQESLDGVAETSHLSPTTPFTRHLTPVDQAENFKKTKRFPSAISCKERKDEEKKKTRKCPEEKGTERTAA
ncbi:hypothetical protein FQA39_LY06929 [Lamprigera yunnana]|nr:hypothetical protein FQA39_LY06929 [Lamprigera yunnana]